MTERKEKKKESKRGKREEGKKGAGEEERDRKCITSKSQEL